MRRRVDCEGFERIFAGPSILVGLFGNAEAAHFTTYSAALYGRVGAFARLVATENY